MYATGNPRTKKVLKERVAAGEVVRAFQPGGIFPGQKNDQVTIEGPHFPEAHKWYAKVRLENSRIVQVLR